MPNDLTPPPDLREAETRELERHEAESLATLAQREVIGHGFDPTKHIDERFLYQVLTRRLELVRSDQKFTTAHLRVYLSLVLSTTAAEAVMWAWTVRNIYEEMYENYSDSTTRAIVGLHDWAKEFDEGIPTSTGRNEIWTQQKLQNGQYQTDNKLDVSWLWPIDGLIIEES